MKAMVRAQYAPPHVLQFAKVEKPIPKNGEVLVKLCAASVNPVDLYRMRGAPLIRLLSTAK
jgi:NADPH:quinone reductase-like Zn-dependent oxidoreductase